MEESGSPSAHIDQVLRRGVTAAVLTPFAADGTVRLDAVGQYARGLAEGGVGALAVAVHTGRGGRLDATQRERLVREFVREGGLPVVAGVGGPSGREPAGGKPDAHVETALRDAEALARAGADALVCFPGPKGSPESVARLHERVAGASGLPVIGFALYEAASGHEYSTETLEALATARGVVAVKLAYLRDAIACQDAVQTLRSHNPDVAVLTGEDRMLGPSLMWGADGALVGAAAALPRLTVRLVEAWHAGRLGDFVRACARFDALAVRTFRQPIEGYVQRMAWIATATGIIDSSAAHDPWVPELPDGERTALQEWVMGLSAGPSEESDAHSGIGR